MAHLLSRIGFIDETSLKTNMAKTTGWSPKGARLIDHAPFGHWNTQTFIAALRHDRLDAPWVTCGAMNGELFELYVETQLAPTLQTGDVIILDNLSSHKSPKAAEYQPAMIRTLVPIGGIRWRRCGRVGRSVYSKHHSNDRGFHHRTRRCGWRANYRA